MIFYSPELDEIHICQGQIFKMDGGHEWFFTRGPGSDSVIFDTQEEDSITWIYIGMV